MPAWHSVMFDIIFQLLLFVIKSSPVITWDTVIEWQEDIIERQADITEWQEDIIERQADIIGRQGDIIEWQRDIIESAQWIVFWYENCFIVS